MESIKGYLKKTKKFIFNKQYYWFGIRNFHQLSIAKSLGKYQNSTALKIINLYIYS